MTTPPRSRLEKTLFRLQAQHACLAWAFEEIREQPGYVVEFGLGLGRTYDHLRSFLPDREIYVFDRVNDAYPDCQPPDAYFMRGEISDTVPALYELLGGKVVLANTDLGSSDKQSNRALSQLVSEVLPPLMAPRGIVMSDLALDLPGFDAVPLPQNARDDAYCLYRRPA